MWSQIGGTFLQYWELCLLLLTWLGIGAVAIQRRRDWRRRRFTEQVNFSLNTLEAGTTPGTASLALRTLFETSTRQVWLNEHGVSLVQRAAARTSPADPFVRIAAPHDRELVKLGVLNALSERFSEACLARAMGLPVQTDRFLFALTWERYGPAHLQKLRVMVVRRSDLAAMFNSDGVDGRIEVAVPHHRDRIRTLRGMWSLDRSADPKEREHIGEVELGVPA